MKSTLLKKSFIKNKTYYYIFITASILILLSQFIFPSLLADDNYYKMVVANQYHNNLLAFLKFHYDFWSSRLIIEAVLSILVKYFWLWRILNSLIIVSLIAILNAYFNPAKNKTFLLFSILLLLLIPSQQLYETGWVATTLNYLWPVTFCLYGFYPIFKKLKDQRTLHLYDYLLTTPLLLFALNQEQVNICYFSFLLCTIVYIFVVHQKVFLLIPQLLISSLQLIFTFTTPGNTKRTAIEAANRFPDFIHYSLFHKIDLGFTAVGRMLFIENDFLITIFLIILVIMVFSKTNKISWRCLSLIPVSFNLLFIFFSSPNNKTIFNLLVPRFLSKITNTGTGAKLLSPLTWIPDFCFLISILAIVLSLFIIYRDISQKILFSIIFIMGILSKFIMGFSPTVWASGNRTGFITYICLVIILLSFLQIKLARRKV